MSFTIGKILAMCYSYMVTSNKALETVKLLPLHIFISLRSLSSVYLKLHTHMDE